MALTEETKVDKIEILEDGRMQVRKSRIIYDDGKEISRMYDREVLDPALPEDHDRVAQLDERLQQVAATVWTPEVIEERTATAKAEVERRRIIKEEMRAADAARAAAEPVEASISETTP